MKHTNTKSKMQKFIAIFLLLQILFPGWVQAASNSLSLEESINKELIILLKKEEVTVSEENLENISSMLPSNVDTITDVLSEENIVVVEHSESIFEKALSTITWISEEQKREDAIRKIEQNPNVEMVQPNFVYEAESFTPSNDPLYSLQWSLENNGKPITGMSQFYQKYFWQNISVIPSIADVDIDYEEALHVYQEERKNLNDAEKNKKTIVAIMDSGVDYNLQEFREKMWDGSNCVSWTGAIMDGCKHGYTFPWDIKDGIRSENDQYHGTNAASIVAATGNNHIGMTGIAPDAEIMSLNVFGQESGATTINQIKAINFAKNNGATILNMSLWATRNLNTVHSMDYLLYDAMRDFPWIIVKSAWNLNIMIDNIENTNFPAIFAKNFEADGKQFSALPNLIVVGAETPSGNKASFSNYGQETVHLMAPGSELIVTGNNGNNTELIGSDYDMNHGTSFAAPMVTASLAFLQSAHPQKNLQELKSAILNTTEKVDEYRNITIHGGRLNLANAIKSLKAPISTPIIDDSAYKNELSGVITQDINTWTKSGVTLTLKTNKNINTPQNWEKISDTEFRKNISKNWKISLNIDNNIGQSLLIEHDVLNIDNLAPGTHIISPDNNFVTSDENAIIKFQHIEMDSGISYTECKINDHLWSKCESPLIVKFSNNGSHNIKIRATDNAGHIGEVSEINITKILSSQNNTTDTPVSPPTENPNTNPTNNNTANSTETGGGPGWISANIPTNIITNNAAAENNKEDELVLSSAPSNHEDNYKIIANFSNEDIYKKYDTPLEKLEYADFSRILEKKWYQNEKMGKIYNFSVTEKKKFFESYINAIEKSQENHLLRSYHEQIIPKNTILNSITNLYDNFIDDWKNGKFFILNP